MFEIDLPRKPEPNGSGFPLKKPRWITNLEIQENSSTGFHRGPMGRKRQWIAQWSLLAQTVDTLLLLGLSLLFSFVLQKVALNFTGSYLKATRHELMIFVCLNFCLLSMIYFTFSRLLFAKTLGEWTCGLRLGTKEQQDGKHYLVKIFLRMSIQTMTGFVVFPTLSLIFKKDFLGHLLKLAVIPGIKNNSN